MTKSSESHKEGERLQNSSIEPIEQTAEVQAAQLAGADEIKAFQLTNANAHSGSAGGEEHESIQIVALDESGLEKILAERPSGK